MFNGVVLAEAEVLKWQYAVFNGVVLMCSQGGSHEGWLELLYCDVMRGRVDPEDDIIRMHYLIWKKNGLPVETSIAIVIVVTRLLKSTWLQLLSFLLIIRSYRLWLTEVRQELGTEQPVCLASVFFPRLILHAHMKPKLSYSQTLLS